MCPYRLVALACGLILLGSSCSWIPFNKDCCKEDRTLGLTYLQEPGQFTTTVPVSGSARDYEPAPGETITKPGLLSKYNPLKGIIGSDEDNPPVASDEEDGFFRNLLPF